MKEVNGLDGAEGFEGVKSFDFSMKGSALEPGKNLVMVEYPLEVPDGCVPVGTSTDMRQVARYTLKVNGITGEHEFESEYSDN